MGITLLKSTLIFVYFRNKHNSLDEKVNLVFTTIQEHNEKMQQAAEEEMQRMNEFQRQRQMQMQMMHQQTEHDNEVNESEQNVEDIAQYEVSPAKIEHLENIESES